MMLQHLRTVVSTFGVRSRQPPVFFESTLVVGPGCCPWSSNKMNLQTQRLRQGMVIMGTSTKQS
ncbi:MAG: hypothetical protein ACP5O7_03460 [Phycisphaerae bacterium]